MRQFILRAANLFIIVCILVSYQNYALARAVQVEAYDQEVAQAAALAEEYAAQEAAVAEEEGYTDGVYQGTGTGFGGTITVEVTVEEGKLTKIDLMSADGEDPAYFQQAEAMVDRILEAQSAEVDTVSGATYSSQGIREAVETALEEAK